MGQAVAYDDNVAVQGRETWLINESAVRLAYTRRNQCRLPLKAVRR